MAFKMRAGKEGPMKKNFGSALKKPLVGNQKNLPDHLKKKILDAPTKAMKDNAPMTRMEKGAMKKMGSPNKIDFKSIKKGFKDYFADLTGRKTSKERAKQSERENELRTMRDKNPKQFAESSKKFPDLVYDPDKKK